MKLLRIHQFFLIVGFSLIFVNGFGQTTEVKEVYTKNEMWWTGSVEQKRNGNTLTYEDHDNDVLIGDPTIGGYHRGYIKFPIHVIETSAIVQKVELYIYQYNPGGLSHQLVINNLNVDPEITGGYSLWNAISNINVDELYRGYDLRGAVNNNSWIKLVLNNAATNILQSLISSGNDYFAIGLKDHDDRANMAYVYGYKSSKRPYLKVYYTLSQCNITVTSPSSNSSWQVGTTHNITWNDNIGDNVKIELYKGSTNQGAITNSTASDGSRSWTVPNISAGTNYRIKISNVANSSCYDFSDYFSITEPTPDCNITVTSPTSNSNWQVGTTHNITWNDNIGDNVKIELYKGSTNQGAITNSTASDGSRSWTVPNISAGTNYRIKISNVANSSCYDFSDYFSITEPTPDCNITVTSPTSNSNWQIGTTHNITWNDNFGDNVKIELYKSSFSIELINSSTASDGSYNWTIPTLSYGTGSNYRIKISNVANSSCYDYSDYFSITEPAPDCNITVTSPTSNSNWQVGTTHNITWNDNIGDNVKIELYKGSTNQGAITNSTASDGSRSWAVPNISAGTNYRIKISNVANSSCYDFSDYFSITAQGIFTIISPANGETNISLNPTLKWDYSEHNSETEYGIWWQIAPGSWAQIAGTSNKQIDLISESTLSAWQKLDPSTTYCWKVGLDGETDFYKLSETACFTTISNLPNLRPNILPGWDTPIVASMQTGTMTTSNLYTNAPTYIDFSYINDSKQNISESFHVALYFNGELITEWEKSSLTAETWTMKPDFPITTHSSGTYAIKIVIDNRNEIVESNEGDNEYTEYFNWSYSAVGIDENDVSNDLKVYPNPTTDKLYVEIPDIANEQYLFEIYAFDGSLLKSIEETSGSDKFKKEIDCSVFANGTYFIKIISDKKILTKKFTVIRND